jgi:hypothetical protein
MYYMVIILFAPHRLSLPPAIQKRVWAASEPAKVTESN